MAGTSPIPAGTKRATSPVVAVMTHDLSPLFRPLVTSLLAQVDEIGAELHVIASEPSPDTRSWLGSRSGRLTVVETPPRCGPGAARNAALGARPDAPAYYFFDDDVILLGGELAALARMLESGEQVGLVSGFPTTEDGVPLVPSFTRRPLDRAVPELWNRWWGPRPEDSMEGRLEADLVSPASIGIRGSAAREVGGFDAVFWPGCHEDTDFCARLRLAGYKILVDPSLVIRQKVSTTMGHVLGTRHWTFCRSTGVLYAVMDYPAPLAGGRLAEAVLRSFIGPGIARRGDAEGVLRTAQHWRHVLHRRRTNRRLIERRRRLPPPA